MTAETQPRPRILVNLLVLAADMLLRQGSGECAAGLQRLMYTDHHCAGSVSPFSLLPPPPLSNRTATYSLRPCRTRR